MRYQSLTLSMGLVWIIAACGRATSPPPTPSPPPSSTSFPSPPPIVPSATPSVVSPTRTPTPVPLDPSVAIVGTEEMVFDWTTDRCAAPSTAPDLPVRAFRDADGMVQINLSNPSNFRMIGEDLDALEVDCEGTLVSDVDPDPSQFSFLEWMGATYTLDGETVYALIHNEFHGDEASAWDAWRDFGSAQGADGWYYQGWNGSSYSAMWFDAASNYWQGERGLCRIGPGWSHPDRGCDPTRTWSSPVSATITISGRTYDSDPVEGDGVVVTILKGSEELWSAVIEDGDTEGQVFDLQVAVREGDAIHFRVNGRGEPLYDTTALVPEINVGPDPCAPGRYCSMISLTYAESTDGGRTFTQPTPPGHLVANLPYRYEPNWGLYAIWQPSNIVNSPRDGYYYALIQLDIYRAGESHGVQGMCVMRTATLDDPTSWRAWDGDGFTMRFVNPYLEPAVDPEEATCALVSPNQVGALTYSLTYNAYFDRFLAVGHGVNEPIPGFYYSLSDDLIHWTDKKLLMATDLAQTTGGPFLAYPSLVDPDSPSPSFDVTGQHPYLYYSVFQSRSLVDVDLRRVRVEFSR